MTKPARSRAKPKLPNGHRAVMASRREKDTRDFYPTPPWATRALCAVVLPRLEVLPSLWNAWEPACGQGHMSDILAEYFGEVLATDIRDYRRMGRRLDFLTDSLVGPWDWIITNPPFSLALEFTLKALDEARVGVAMFVRSQWAIEGVDRFDRLWRDRPPTLTAFFTERVNLCKGRWDPDGSTATAYCWLVWVRGREPMAPFYIPPGQRKALSRPDDRARFAAWSLPAASTSAQQEAAE